MRLTVGVFVLFGFIVYVCWCVFFMSVKCFSRVCFGGSNVEPNLSWALTWYVLVIFFCKNKKPKKKIEFLNFVAECTCKNFALKWRSCHSRSLFVFCLVWIKIREFVKLILGIFTIITCLSNLCTQTLFSGHFTNRCLTVCSSIPMYFFLTSTRQPSVLIHSSAVKSFALVSVVLEFFLVWFFTVRYRCRYVQSCNNRQFPSR